MELKYYKYKAKDRNGYNCAGTLKAMSEEAAREQLELKDLKPYLIEEDNDASRRVSRNTLRQQVSGKRRGSLKNEILSYAMPMGAIVVGLLGIPLALHFIKPVILEQPPEKVIEQYFEFDRYGSYKEQYELLSPSMRKSYSDGEKYVEEKRRERMDEDPSVYQGRINSMEIIKETQRLRHFRVRLFRTTGMDIVYIHLIPHKKKWTIDAVRDPAKVGRAFKEMAETAEDERRPIIVELKKMTAYSDQEIEKLFKEYRLAGHIKSENPSFQLPF